MSIYTLLPLQFHSISTLLPLYCACAKTRTRGHFLMAEVLMAEERGTKTTSKREEGWLICSPLLSFLLLALF